MAEESILSSARLVKAFKNLDRGLVQEGVPSASGIASKARAAPPRSRSPRRDHRPPLPRAPTPPRPPSPPRELRRANRGRAEEARAFRRLRG